jgi:hypothetical protein
MFVVELSFQRISRNAKPLLVQAERKETSGNIPVWDDDDAPLHTLFKSLIVVSILIILVISSFI